MFTITKILGGGVLVEGQDITGREGRTILRSPKWERYELYLKQQEADEVFGATVKEFFAPVVAAAEQLKMTMAPADEAYRTIVISEGTDGTEREELTLDDDGVVLRILNETDGSTLRWIGEDILVAIEP